MRRGRPAIDAVTTYERYWKAREGAARARLRRRSLQRARVAHAMLSVRSGTLLDVGCGPGYAAEFFAGRGFAVTGLEPAPSAAQEARERGIAVIEGDVAAGALPPGPFDVVLALEVLEHLVDPIATLGMLMNAARPGGEVVVSLPNEWHILRRLALLLGAEPVGGAEDPHVRHFGVRSARRLFDAAGVPVRDERVVSIVPPWSAAADAAGRVLARAAPRLFGLSVLFLARKEGR